MYAVIETGGRQYRIKENDLIDVELLKSQSQGEIKFSNVLLISNGDKIIVGRPFVKDAYVICKKIGEIKSKKKIIFKFRRRKASKKKTGHRQRLLRLKVEKIVVK
ncbi:MAG: 50S ribosomal protein L21 [Candidatus Omnitrophica bacterium]|nr:50S ribosomal protein L21 [Candidatus Omnitrophota bacterium]